MQIALESANQPDVVRLIEELDAYQMPLYPAESHHGIDLVALTQPNVLFAVIRDAGQAIGCGAVVLGEEYGEIKRMFVLPKFRGCGLSKQLLAYLESKSFERGCSTFTLETGIKQPEALGLYERAGYRRCAPFGDYKPDPNSVFMHKRIEAGANHSHGSSL